MPILTIDGRQVEVAPGATILDAARKLDVAIPTLCHRSGCSPSTSCLVCLVKVQGNGRLVPSCATVAVDGMTIESGTDEVLRARRAALELLLSDHLGDCLAPCQFGCPAGMDIPRMLRQIAAGDFAGAIATVKRDIVLPAVLGRICPAPCEKACRRRPADDAVAICRLKRLVADADLAAPDRYLPECLPGSGRRVAIVGAGPAGWSAAYYLLTRGHGVTVFDENPLPGGRLRTEATEVELPRDVLDADLRAVELLGTELRMNERIDGKKALDDLCRQFDAVLIAAGATAAERAAAWGLAVGTRGIQVEADTYETSLAGVFAAGNALRGKGLAIRSLADGKEAAAAIDQYLSGRPVIGQQKPFSTRIGRLEADELAEYLAGAGRSPRREPAAGSDAGFSPEEGIDQAARCMHCDCRGQADCTLRRVADEYRADPRRYKSERRPFRQDRRHARVIFEPGKCIQCGLCIEIAEKGGESLGLTFIGRGFDVRVGVPLDGAIGEGLTKMAAECIAACPTAALAWADGKAAEPDEAAGRE